MNNMFCVVCGSKTKGNFKLCKPCEGKICEDYFNNPRSAYKVGEDYNISHTTIDRIICKNGYETRNLKDVWTPERKEKHREWMRKNSPMKKSEVAKKVSNANKGKKRGPHSEEHKRKISESQLGKHVSEETRKKLSEYAKTRVGPSSSNWQGGKSYEPYCEKWTEDLRERCREFWNRTCVMSGISEEENGQRLSVHHVTYYKKACCEVEKFNSCPNLFVPVSNKWNSMFNKNRKYWEEMLSNYIMIWFNGECYLEKEEC